MKTMFSTTSLVEAALMFMRTGSVKCEWSGRSCTFRFDADESDIEFASNVGSMVPAGDFHRATVAVKSAMYASQPSNAEG